MNNSVVETYNKFVEFLPNQWSNGVKSLTILCFKLVL